MGQKSLFCIFVLGISILVFSCESLQSILDSIGNSSSGTTGNNTSSGGNSGTPLSSARNNQNRRADPDAANWDIDKLDTARDTEYLSLVEKDVILEMNKVRSDPKKYAELYIKGRLQYFDENLYSAPGEVAIQTKEGKKAVEGCYNALIKMQPAPLLYPENGLSLAAKDHAADQSKTGQTGHSGSDHSTPASRVSRYGTGSYIGENIAYGSYGGRDIIVDLLIDDGVPSRGHRQNIMKRDYNQTGTAEGSHPQYGSICVINYAKNYTSASTGKESAMTNADGRQNTMTSSAFTVRRSAPNRQLMEYTRPLSHDEAYSWRTDTADQRIRSLPRNIESLRTKDPDEFVRQASAYISENSKNQFDTVKKIHDLVALTVRYDAASFLSDKYVPQDYASVLKNRLGVCEGYANAFQRFCEELGIESEKVHGYARGVGFSPFINDTPSDSNHAWNIVKINDACYLIDCTWDSGHLRGSSYQADYTTDYLFLKPEYFVYTHFPDNPRQQLLENPFSASDFSRLPLCRPKYFDTIPEEKEILPKLSGAEKGEVQFEFKVNEEFIPDFELYSEDGKTKFSNNVFVQKEGEVYRAYLSFPESGKYLLRYFPKKRNARSGKFCAEFGIIADEGSNIRYPVQYANFNDNFTILSPLEMPLEKNKTYTFKVKAENTNGIVLMYNKNFIPLTKGDDGYFYIETEIPSGVRELSIGTANGVRGPYHSLVTYQVK
ncbi:MAG: CAP domain-containing protein [Treponema sp.]|jgi:uncharacterized protein YkwD|nr:CAP domain-containing protein [Treponema sp.]